MSELSKVVADWRKEPTAANSRNVCEQLLSQSKKLLVQKRAPKTELEDMAQECMIRMWKLIQSGYAEGGKEQGLLSRIVRNCINGWWRSPQRKEQVLNLASSKDMTGERTLEALQQDPSLGQSFTVSSPEEDYLARETLDQVEQALASMQPSPRYVFLQLHCEKKSIAELAHERLQYERTQSPDEAEAVLYKRCHNWVTSNKRRALLHLKPALAGGEQ